MPTPNTFIYEIFQSFVQWHPIRFGWSCCGGDKLSARGFIFCLSIPLYPFNYSRCATRKKPKDLFVLTNFVGFGDCALLCLLNFIRSLSFNSRVKLRSRPEPQCHGNNEQTAAGRQNWNAYCRIKISPGHTNHRWHDYRNSSNDPRCDSFGRHNIFILNATVCARIRALIKLWRGTTK